jgi:hypothetical protein
LPQPYKTEGTGAVLLCWQAAAALKCHALKMEKAGITRPSIKRLNQCQFIRGQKSGEFLKLNLCIDTHYFKNMTVSQNFCGTCS